MIKWIKIYLITFGVFFVVDLIWLGLIAKKLYRHYLGDMIKTNVHWDAAILFYILFVIGIVFFVLNQALILQSWKYFKFPHFLKKQ